MIRSRCINTLTPTRPDRPHDEAEEGGEEEEDGLAILEQSLETPVVRGAPLVTATSMVNVSNQEEWQSSQVFGTVPVDIIAKVISDVSSLV